MLRLQDFTKRKDTICVVGQGYIGLPLSILFDKKFRIIGYDANPDRIDELKKGHDRTNEITPEELARSTIDFTSVPERISEAKIIIICVPTPIDEYKKPDLGPVVSATAIVGKNIQKGSIIVYESTVYPGVTEEVCVPVLEKESNLKWQIDFNVGYSPERVNPGDREHTVEKITKVVSGDSSKATELLSQLYGSVITAGIHIASSIKIAEAAKVIENTQRDLNIALMNELSLIFHMQGIDTKEVLEAAGTKWNFLKFEPGLVGGHCIGVDPYYLTFKAESLGYHPQVILAGRRINDSMGKYIAENTIKLMIQEDRKIKDSNVLLLGLTFKENVPDIRNSRIIDIYHELSKYKVNVQVYDPHAHNEEVKEEYGIDLIDDIDENKPYDAIIVAVKHECFIRSLNFKRLKDISNHNIPILIDIKGLYSKDDAIHAGFIYWRL